MPGVKRSALRNYGSRPYKRRRTAYSAGGRLSTRIRYKRPSARNQQKQIYALSRRVARNTRIVKSSKIFTDYQYGDEGADTKGFATFLTLGTWFGIALTDFSKWIPVMRRDTNVAESSRTYCARMQINLRLNLNDVTTASFINIFLVSPRRQSTDAIGLNPPPDGKMSNLVAGDDYVEMSSQQGINIRLNTGKFKVHAAKYVTLTANTLDTAVVATENVGDPITTYRKWQWNVPLKFSAVNPHNTPWPEIAFDNMPYYQKYYLIAFAMNVGGTYGPSLTVDPLYTCINFD